MTYTHKAYTGTLFSNERKEKDTHPDWKGSCDINGVKHWVSGWNRSASDGRTRISLAFTIAEDKPKQSPAPQQGSADEEIPF